MNDQQTNRNTDRQKATSRCQSFNSFENITKIKKKERNACFVVETWILFRENDEVVSNVIQEAYEHYEAMEFGRDRKDIGDPNRHVKLINIAGKKVMFAGLVHKNNYIYDLDEPVYLLFILQFHRVYLILPQIFL